MNYVEQLFLGVPIQISGADTKKINENIYELTPEIYKPSLIQDIQVKI